MTADLVMVPRERLESLIRHFDLGGSIDDRVARFTTQEAANLFREVLALRAAAPSLHEGGGLCSLPQPSASSVPAGGKPETEGLLLDDVQYEVVTDEGDFCASSDTLSGAQHYAVMYGQEGPVRINVVIRVPLKAFPKAVAALSKDENRKLGKDFAQQNEPNTLPTVQAETAVVETVECETCGGTGKIVEEARLTGPNQHSACQMDCEDCDGTGQAAVSTGEQPGMSEANAPKKAVLSGEEISPKAPPPLTEAPVLASEEITLPDDLLSLSEADRAEALATAKELARLAECELGVRGGSQHCADVMNKAVNFIRTLAAKQGGKS